MEKVESFKLDHTKVKAPYVRKCCVLDGKSGDKVSKFDLRFLQPNVEAFGTASIHGLEHLLATYLREELEGLIDLSPMGCRTGFYLLTKLLSHYDAIKYTEDPIVSSDVIGKKRGCTFDSLLTNVIEVEGKQLVKLVGWYDNEYGYTYQMLCTAKKMFK